MWVLACEKGDDAVGGFANRNKGTSRGPCLADLDIVDSVMAHMYLSRPFVQEIHKPVI